MPKFLILLVIMLSTCAACRRAENKGKAIVNKTKNSIKRERDKLADKVIPTFDDSHPDTKYNKQRFKEFFYMDATPDVKNLYCFDDAIGIDADYEFSFDCNDTTITQIIKNLKLVKTTKESVSAYNLGPDLSWWDKTDISSIDPYWKKGEHETYWYLWYNKKTKHAYFITYDM